MVVYNIWGTGIVFDANLNTKPTLVGMGNISDRPYSWTMTWFSYYNIYYIYIAYMMNCHLIMLHVLYKQLILQFNNKYVMCIYIH